MLHNNLWSSLVALFFYIVTHQYPLKIKLRLYFADFKGTFICKGTLKCVNREYHKYGIPIFYIIYLI